MPRPNAWLEKMRGCYGIRYRDPVKRKPDGSPVYPFVTLYAKNGEKIRTKLAAQPLLDEFLAKMPVPKKRTSGSIEAPTRYTIMQLALRWHREHPDNRVRDAYMSSVQRLVGEQELNATYPHDLTAKAVLQYKLDRNYVGVHKRLAYLRSILNWAQHHPDNLVDPLCPRLMSELSQPQSRRSRYPLMTEAEYAASMEEARRWGPNTFALATCLSTFGWRPISACKMKVGDVDLANLWVSLTHTKDVSVDRDHEPHEHPLPRQVAEVLRPIIEGRDPDEHLFLHGSKPWRLVNDGAGQYTDWYRRTIKPLAPKAGNSNAWKRYAVHRMTQGMPPWTERLDDERIRQFTGHDDVTVVARYRKTNREEMRRAAGLDEDPSDYRIDDDRFVLVDAGVNDGQPLTDPDESVSFGT